MMKLYYNDQQQWRHIPDTHFEVDIHGRVRNIRSKREVAPVMMFGHPFITVRNMRGGMRSYKPAELVATLFFHE